jgi:dipeptidyl aminopeptidase/acylaminoacyl peptidase
MPSFDPGFGTLGGLARAKDRVAFGGVLESPSTEFGQGAVAGEPGLYTGRQLVIEASPIFYVDRVHTPLLITWGTRDDVAPKELGDELFVRMRQLGKPVEYVSYADEQHWYEEWSYEHRVDRWQRVLKWFEFYLKQGG